MPETRSRSTNYRHLLGRYARYAPRYDRLFARYSAATLGRALEIIPLEGAAKILDVACGTGLLLDMIRRQRPDVCTTGIDISPQMLELAKQRIPAQTGRVEWSVGHAEQLPVGSNQFDVLTCTNAFHLVQDARTALVEFRRVLKAEGTLVLVDWCLDYPVMKFRNAVLRVIDHQQRSIRRLHQLADLIDAAGFAIQSKRRFRSGLWGMMCVVAQNPRMPSIARDLQPDAMPAKRAYSPR